MEDLTSALGLGPKEHVAIVGAGGKTSLMFALAEELRLKGRRVITATTTKVWAREAERAPCVMFSMAQRSFPEKVRTRLEELRHVFAAESPMASGKVKGISPGILDLLHRSAWVDYVIVEADGAAGHPLKAPAPQEPVIPATSTLVVAMAGLDALGKPAEPEVVFRLGLFEKLTGIHRGETLGPETIVRIFENPEGLFKGTPKSARQIVFLNKEDLMRGHEAAGALAERIVSRCSVERAVLGSILKTRYRIFEKRHEGNLSHPQ